MAPPLLTTKLYIPTIRPELVPRPRLIERLNTGLHRKLTLVSAPAGFGKTTLVSEWVAGSERFEPKVRFAWLSLDEGDNDLIRFLVYFVAALQTVEADVGKGVLGALQSPQPPPTETILTPLINEIAAIPDRIVLILDDYHLIEAGPIHDALTFLLRRLPPQMHLVIATREDPPLPLTRLRARGQLTELRATDLRFTSSEAAEFLNTRVGLNLSAEDGAALERRTEGWITGLQLAAISMQGHEDVRSFIDAFAGTHRHILDYLTEEVLRQRPRGTKDFLLQTSVLDRLCGSLCDAVTGRSNSHETLARLEQANLFIVPLDNERRWYRYHHLFADLLRQRLREIQPEQVPTLHRQAGTWYEDQGLAAEALRHIFAAGDFQWAGRLVEQVGTATFWKQGDWTSMLHWLDKLPESVLHSQPRLCLFSAWAMHVTGQPKAVESYLRYVESHLRETGDGLDARADRPIDASSAVSPSSKDVQSMKAEVATIRAFATRVGGDLPRAIELFHRALELLPSNEIHLQTMMTAGLAETHYVSGDIVAAGALYAEVSAFGWEGGSVYMASISARRFAEVQVIQGHLHQAANTCQQLQRLLTSRGEQHAPVAGYACVGMGELLYEWNDLDAALQQLREAIEHGKQGANARILVPGYVALARALQAMGETDRALGAIQEATQVWQQYRVNRLWGVPPVATYQARLWLAQGDVASAAQWAQEQELRADGELSYQREVDYITLARLLIAQGNSDEAVGLLQRLLEAAETGGRTSRVIEILMLHALALQARDNTTRAITALGEALILAESGGFIRIFVDEGPPMARLLYEAATRGIAPDYARRLLSAFPVADPEQTEPSRTQAAKSELVEPLSERELEILQLIAEGLTNPEIASRLFLALNTVKTHSRNIYGKLGVHSRTQAVARARALGILSSS